MITRRHQFKATLVSAVLGLVALIAAPNPASASAAASSQFTFANVATGTDTPPFGQIIFNCATATSCSMDLGALGNNVFFDTNALDLNLNSGVTSVTFDAATSSGSFGAVTVNTDFSTGPGSGFQNDGFGRFNTQVNIFDGTNSGISGTDILELSITGTGLNNANLLVLNGGGFDASGHVFSPTVGASCTFKVGEGTGPGPTPSTTNCEPSTNVPEPASLAIFGTALAGLGLIRRRRRRSV